MEGIIGDDIGLITEMVITVIEDMDVVEVILGEVILEEDIILEVDIIVIVEWTGLGKIGECGDNLGQEKELKIAEVGHHLVPGRGQGLVRIEIGSGVLNVESMNTLLTNVPIWSLITQIGKVTVQGLHHCIWQIVIQDWM